MLEVDQLQIVHETILGALITAVVLQDAKGLGARLFELVLVTALVQVLVAVVDAGLGLFEFILPDLTTAD